TFRLKKNKIQISWPRFRVSSAKFNIHENIYFLYIFKILNKIWLYREQEMQQFTSFISQDFIDVSCSKVMQKKPISESYATL
ncbi:hypothetical protein ACJX0J_019571, partial [Zea mays]